MQGFDLECHRRRQELHLRTDHLATATLDFFSTKREQANKKQSSTQSEMQWQTAVQVRASIQCVVFGVEEKRSFSNLCHTILTIQPLNNPFVGFTSGFSQTLMFSVRKGKPEG